MAVDLGGTKMLAGVVDSEGVVVRRTVRPTNVAGEEELLAELDRAVSELADEGVEAIGVGIPSAIDQRAGRAVSSVNIPLDDVDLGRRLTERFGLPAAIENDANAAALAEHRYGAGRGSKHMVMLTLGTGVGGGLILDGRLYRGAVGAAAELGHITIDLDGPPCQGLCPGRGHLEALASGRATDSLAREMAAARPDGDLGRAAADGREVDARLVVDLAADGPGDARELLEQVGFHLGIGIANFVTIFNPEVVVLGGGFARAGDLLLEPARRVARGYILEGVGTKTEIRLARYGPQAGVRGAALLARQELEDSNHRKAG